MYFDKCSSTPIADVLIACYPIDPIQTLWYIWDLRGVDKNDQRSYGNHLIEVAIFSLDDVKTKN